MSVSLSIIGKKSKKQTVENVLAG